MHKRHLIVIKSIRSHPERRYLMSKKITVILSLIICTVLLFSCGSKETKDESSNKIVLRTIENIEEYKIVRADFSTSNAAKDASLKLKKAISESLGVDIKLATDMSVGSEKEILIGKTNRIQSKNVSESLLYGDYFIGIKDEKIVIDASTDECLAKAIDFFISNFINAETKTIKAPLGNGYLFKGDYKFEKVSIEGVPLSEFTLYTEAKEFDLKNAAKLIKEELAGIELKSTNKIEDGKHYIIIDNSSLTYDLCKIEVDNGNLCISGSYSGAIKAVEYFTKELFKDIKETEYNITADDNYEGSIGKQQLYTKDQLYAVLKAVYDDPNACIIGEEAIPYLGNAYTRFYDATKEYPGMIGIDLTEYGQDLSSESREMWSKQLCQIYNYVAEKGIVNISTHFTNPSGNIPDGDYQHCRGTLGVHNSKAEYDEEFKNLITEGTDLNKSFKAELEIMGEFMKALHDNGIPVLYRPFHEMNGYWFWWCVGQGDFCVDAENYVNLWKYVYNYFVNELGIDSMLWVYAPDISDSETNSGPEEYAKAEIMSSMYCYPGDDYVDIVGNDWYTRGKLEIGSNDCYTTLVNTVKKPGAITEFGPRGEKNANQVKKDTGDTVNQIDLYSNMDLLNDLLLLKNKGYSFTYILSWINQWSITKLGAGEEFMAASYTYGLSDVAKLFEKTGVK